MGANFDIEYTQNDSAQRIFEGWAKGPTWYAAAPYDGQDLLTTSQSDKVSAQSRTTSDEFEAGWKNISAVKGGTTPRQPETADGEVRFGRFTLVPSARALLCNGTPVTCGSRAYDLLVALVSSRGSVVSKKEIMDRVWPTTHVDESNLRFQMASLRKILGPEGDLIKTIPGRGYLFASGTGGRASIIDEVQDLLTPAKARARLSVEATGSNFCRFAVPECSDNSAEGVVVLIDNDIKSREALECVLGSAGLPVTSFSSVRAYLDSAPLARPACLILEVWLPGKSGLDFQADLAKAGVRVPIIFISGWADVHTSVRAMKGGAVEFLMKPVRHQDLIDAVRAATDPRQATQAVDSTTRRWRQVDGTGLVRAR